MNAPESPTPEIHKKPHNSKIAPPNLENYRVSPNSDYVLSEDYQMRSAPELGGTAAILAEFDAASRSDQFTSALQKLIRCRENIVPDLLERLESGEVSTSKKAAIALGYLRSPLAIAPLIASIQAPHSQIIWQSAASLSWIGSTEAINALIKLLQHPSIQVQSAAAKALGKTSLSAVLPLIDTLKYSDDLVKVHAAHSLGQIASPLAVPELIDALASSSKSVRFEAAWALGQIKSPNSVNSLANLLTDNDISVQSQAVQALKNISGSTTITAVARMLNTPSSHTRSVAARTLGQMGMPEVVPLLYQVLRDDEYAYVRADAALALGEIGTHDAVFYLSQSLKDSDRSVRSAILRALAQINSPESMEVLHNVKHTIAIPSYSVSNIPDVVSFGEDSDFTIIQG